MWVVTRAEAIEMYARFWTARYETNASGSARKMASSLESNGDREGNEIWREVADAIDRHLHEKRHARRQETVISQSQLAS